MISTLTGRVSHIGLDSLVLEVHGIGYLVRTTPQALQDARHGAELTMHTELVVREDSLTLFGFPGPEETEVFRILQSVTGIGPRIALAVLAVLSPEDLRRAVASEDAKAITRAPGVGAKVAQRMLLELKDRIGSPSVGQHEAPGSALDGAAPPSGPEAEVVAALVGLGWPEKAAADAVRKEAVENGEDPAALLRAALRRLGGSR